ncbi:lysine exporter protein LysE/YggA [Salinisphaera sp. T5B8]
MHSDFSARRAHTAYRAIPGMDIPTAIAGFALAAGLMTLTPGIDTALVLRTAAVETPRRALCAAFGIVTGLFVWGLVTAFGLGALLAVSELAYRTLQFVGAAYLLWLGAGMLRRAFNGTNASPEPAATAGRAPARQARSWLLRGLGSNLLNPKVGVFYVSFLPQFIPDGANVIAFSSVLALIHVALTLAWFVLLIAATRPFARALASQRVTRMLDGITGAVLVGFGLRLALSPTR